MLYWAEFIVCSSVFISDITERYTSYYKKVMELSECILHEAHIGSKVTSAGDGQKPTRGGQDEQKLQGSNWTSLVTNKI